MYIDPTIFFMNIVTIKLQHGTCFLIIFWSVYGMVGQIWTMRPESIGIII